MGEGLKVDEARDATFLLTEQALGLEKQPTSLPTQ